MNFIKAEDSITPFVCEAFSEDRTAFVLAAGSIKIPFKPDSLRISATGRLYTPFASRRFAGLALLSSHVAVELGPRIEFTDSGPCLAWQGLNHHISAVPDSV